jgi:hypothetical protein
MLLLTSLYSPLRRAARGQKLLDHNEGCRSEQMIHNRDCEIAQRLVCKSLLVRPNFNSLSCLRFSKTSSTRWSIVTATTLFSGLHHEILNCGAILSIIVQLGT